MKLEGNVHKYGSDVNTDVIIPARYLRTMDSASLVRYCMRDIDDTFATRMEDPGFGLLFRRAERPGIYFRVLNEGEIRAGDNVMLVECDDHDVTVLDLFRYKFSLRHDADDLRRFLEAPIAERFRVAIENTIDSLS